jgi:putative exporter of polyketide antibiotics
MRWAMASGVGVWVAIVVTVALLAVSIGIGAALAGDDAVQPVLGTFVVAAYGMAMAGIGLAVGGLTRSSYAGPAVLVVAIGTFLIDILGEALRLPDWFQQLALSSHMGQPMVGRWDGAGLLTCAVLAVGGLLLGAWGMNRRDVSG